MKNLTFLFLTLVCTGCVNLKQAPIEQYLGQEIQSKSDAKKYYGTSVTNLGKNKYEIYVVTPLSWGWESKILDTFMAAIKSICSEKFNFEVFVEKLHGPLGAGIPNAWNAISKKGILECKMKLTRQSSR